MKIKVIKANAFEIDPNKKYICMVLADDTQWSEAQKDQFRTTMSTRNIEVVFLPAGSKFKLVEQPNGQADTAPGKAKAA